jgi:hypothetical protein
MQKRFRGRARQVSDLCSRMAIQECYCKHIQRTDMALEG